MTLKTWTAQTALQLTDPAGWSPPGVPTLNDTAIQSRGVSLGGATFPTTLHFGGAAANAPTLNLIGGGQLNLTFGDNPTPTSHSAGTININYGGIANVALKATHNASSSLTENISYRGTAGGTLTMQGTPHGSLAFTVNGEAYNGANYTHTGDTAIERNDAVTLNATTVGTGSWDVSFLGTLTALQPLSQSVIDSGGQVNLLDVNYFTGTLHMQADSGEVQLGPIFADRAELQAGVLTLFDAGTTLASLKVAGKNYNVWETPTGVELGGRGFVPAGPASTYTHLLHV